MTGITIPRGSVEYIAADLTERSGADLTEDTVEVAIHKGSPEVWLAAIWEDGHVRTEAPVTFSAPNYTLSSYDVSVRLNDAPEHIIVRVGTIRIVR